MKNILKTIFYALAVLSAAACNKAEFQTFKYISFDAKRASILETAGTYKIAVSVHNEKSCFLTYVVTEESATRGDFSKGDFDFDIVDEKGNHDETNTLSLKDGKGYIYVKVKDRSGEETKNKTFSLSLKATTNAEIHKGATQKINCTIIDLDYIYKLVEGDWTSKGLDSDGLLNSWNFSVEFLDLNTQQAQKIREKYPECNVVFNDFDFPDCGMDGTNEIYGSFDINTTKLHLYSCQAFNTYNFTGYGPCDICMCTESHSPKNDITWTLNGESFILDQNVQMGVFLAGSDSYIGYYDDIVEGTSFNKSL